MELPLPHRVALTKPQPCRGLGSCLLILPTSPAEAPVRAGEFSGVCCCAVEAFFLALCPLGRLCAHPAPHCHLYQSGSVT